MLDEICIRRRAGPKFELGSILNCRWKILSSLVHGGGQVSDGCFNRGIKLVQDVSSGQLAVLKMLSPDILCPGHAAREIRILKDLFGHGDVAHENAVRLLDSNEGVKHPHDIPWAVTDLCDAGTLAQLIKMYGDGRLFLPEEFIWHVFDGLAKAVRFCHAQGVIHRDITLTNVLLGSPSQNDTYPTVQLGDFGCAVTQKDMVQSSLANLLPGNPRFLPPEGCEAHKASDIYQTGLVVLCLYMRDNDPTESLADFAAEADTHGQICSPELKSLIEWCMAAKSTERPSAEILVRKIQEAKTERCTVGCPPLLKSAAREGMQIRFCVATQEPRS
ncbi:kinase-like protein [Bimuria novae-zelandiae CBS 107.79]|uniref:EKC/KEOPS complex subunit BUD32 n=1 Tax=Bimuria novae-zelandiae CBS 107.79 TaxID=1447943 RepID=A0A6A5VNH3_9PLEO|nr:kinase-like protein [Bimuria novae-zelandiae CBS 107.79]